MSNSGQHDLSDGIAIIGMAGRFPKARNLREFWQNLCDGLEAISFFTDEELLAAGASPALLKNPNCVKAGGHLDDVDLFDAAFFGFNPREAEITDPQHRIFLECSWEALEDAGYDPETFKGRIGVYSGSGANDYFAEISEDIKAVTDGLSLAIGNEKDFVATRASYKANLKGPSLTVQTACSTSLVTVCLACQSLLNYQSDMALAGGISIDLRKKARLYTEGGILSPDGHCRAFDAKAKGTIWGGGVGVAVLKRFMDAVEDGDHIYAVIRGAAINNDGWAKIGYTAPSVEGQAEVIAEAIALAGVNPETIGYIETHGTATPLGDPIEVAALTKVFRSHTAKKGFCRIGSVKTNIGHTDSAAGIAGLIKTTLSLSHKQIPASLNYEKPNPQIDFENSPFFVNTKLTEWEVGREPRRAGVSSFGIGGTNAHVVLEEAPPAPDSGPSRPWQLVTLSARTGAALETATANLVQSLRETPGAKLSDVCFTLQVGRKAFEHRRTLVCRDREDAIKALEESDPRRILNGDQVFGYQPVVFMFPGQGTQYVDMGRELYELEETFREQVDYCSQALKPELGLDLRDILYPDEARAEEAAHKLGQTCITQPAIFVIEYALARLWMEWGIQPEAMIGHSIGEYVAACLAGVCAVDEALKLVAARGRLVQEIATGSMLAVPMSEQQLQPLLGEELSLAAINGPSLCVVSGPDEALAALERKLEAVGAAHRRLHTSHAFHSKMMEPILERFERVVEGVRLNPPKIPYLSNVTGTWIKDSEATDAAYWVRHLRQTVRFSDGAVELLKDASRALLEVGPGRTLLTLIKQHRDESAERVVAASMRHPHEQYSDQEFLLGALGQLWISGARIDWNGFYRREKRVRVGLPTYPFERKRYWADGGGQQRPSAGVPSPVYQGKRSDLADWFYMPSWRRLSVPSRGAGRTPVDQKFRWVIFTDETGLGAEMIGRLEQEGGEVWSVTKGEGFAKLGARAYALNPDRREDYHALFKELHASDHLSMRIAYLWTVSQGVGGRLEAERVERAQSVAFYGLLYLTQAIGSHGFKEAIRLLVVSNGLQDVTGEEELFCEKATLLGPCRVIPQEYSNINCASVDVVLPATEKQRQRVAAQLMAEFDSQSSDTVIAYRSNHRWVQSFEPVRLEATADDRVGLREGGVYLITGGTGGIGLELAAHLAQTARAKLALVGRRAMPVREEWEAWIVAHGEQDEVSEKIRKLRAIEAAGAEVLLLSADVANREQMAQVIGQTRQRFGAINGVIHSAGVPAGGLIQMKTPEMAEPIFAPKVKGTLVLDSLLSDEQLDFFMLCSSVASTLGAAGQVDYCAANAFLDAFAQHKTRVDDRTHTVSTNWDAWAEVGMAVKASEIWPMTHDGLLDTKKLQQLSAYRQSDHPLFDSHLLEADQSTFLSNFSPAKQWVLSEHRIMGNPTLVGTAYLEMARAAFERHAERGRMQLSDVVFISPLIVREGEQREVQTVVKRDGSGFEFVIKSRLAKTGNGSSAWQEHAMGRIAGADQGSSKKPETLDLAELMRRCSGKEFGVAEYAQVISTGPERSADRLDLDYGPRWSNVKKIHVGLDEVLINLELSEEYSSDLKSYHLHPALLDKATSLAAFQMGAGSDFLPFAYGKLSLHAPLSRKVYSYARHKGSDPTDEVLKFDIVILNEEGTKLVEIEDFTIRKVGERVIQALADHGLPGSNGSDQRSNEAGTGKASADLGLADAILPAEGVEVFRRILSSHVAPQVVVSTRHLESRAQLPETGAAPRALDETRKEPRVSKPAHPRPNIKTPYVAPETEVEMTIAGIWQMVLGMEQVGIHDNFIDLGGHSLLAIQVVSRLREALQMDLAMDSIFKAPTISELANTIVYTLAEQTDDETLAQMLTEIEHLS